MPSRSMFLSSAVALVLYWVLEVKTAVMTMLWSRQSWLMMAAVRSFSVQGSTARSRTIRISMSESG